MRATQQNLFSTGSGLQVHVTWLAKHRRVAALVSFRSFVNRILLDALPHYVHSAHLEVSPNGPHAAFSAALSLFTRHLHSPLPYRRQQTPPDRCDSRRGSRHSRRRSHLPIPHRLAQEEQLPCSQLSPAILKPTSVVSVRIGYD